MLPYFIWKDLEDVVAELNDAGYPFELAWFAAHRDFRFPLLGDFTASGVAVELRMALEPWHVLGEESGGGGTARYVDSSLERVEIKATGLVGERHAITCNGRRIPLHPTGTVGAFVAGVRYRAWQPPSGLHPTIPVHTPLVVDVSRAAPASSEAPPAQVAPPTSETAPPAEEGRQGFDGVGADSTDVAGGENGASADTLSEPPSGSASAP
jgi:uncharacterized protein (DUF2126 family)